MECYIYVALQSLIFWKPFQVPCSEVVQAACVLRQLKAGVNLQGEKWNSCETTLRKNWDIEIYTSTIPQWGKHFCHLHSMISA